MLVHGPRMKTLVGIVDAVAFQTHLPGCALAKPRTSTPASVLKKQPWQTNSPLAVTAEALRSCYAQLVNTKHLFEP